MQNDIDHLLNQAALSRQRGRRNQAELLRQAASCPLSFLVTKNISPTNSTIIGVSGIGNAPTIVNGYLNDSDVITPLENGAASDDECGDSRCIADNGSEGGDFSDVDSGERPFGDSDFSHHHDEEYAILGSNTDPRKEVTSKGSFLDFGTGLNDVLDGKFDDASRGSDAGIVQPFYSLTIR